MVPFNSDSEFAGLSYEEQSDLLTRSYKIFAENGIHPWIFMAPSHTFDEQTLSALKDSTPIRIVTDGLSYRCFSKGDIGFIPQQFGSLRAPLFGLNTYCLHPNTIEVGFLDRLEAFLDLHEDSIASFKCLASHSFETETFQDRLVRQLLLLKRYARARQ